MLYVLTTILFERNLGQVMLSLIIILAQQNTFILIRNYKLIKYVKIKMSWECFSNKTVQLEIVYFVKTILKLNIPKKEHTQLVSTPYFYQIEFERTLPL